MCGITVRVGWLLVVTPLVVVWGVSWRRWVGRWGFGLLGGPVGHRPTLVTGPPRVPLVGAGVLVGGPGGVGCPRTVGFLGLINGA